MILAFQIKLRQNNVFVVGKWLQSVQSRKFPLRPIFTHTYKHYYAKESCSKRKTYSCGENFAYIHVHQKSLIDDTAEHSLIDWQRSINMRLGRKSRVTCEQLLTSRCVPTDCSYDCNRLLVIYGASHWLLPRWWMEVTSGVNKSWRHTLHSCAHDLCHTVVSNWPLEKRRSDGLTKMIRSSPMTWMCLLSETGLTQASMHRRNCISWSCKLRLTRWTSKNYCLTIHIPSTKPTGSSV